MTAPQRQMIMVGAGALGSHLALLARNFGVKLKVIDFDRVEQKNTLSQFHTRMGLGRNKAQALAQSLQGLFGHRVEAIPHKLTADNAHALLSGGDLLVDCLDNLAARTQVQEMARKLDIACLHGALAADGQFGRVIWDEHFTIDAESHEGEATCEDGEHLPFIAMNAACMAQSIQTFLEHGRKDSFHLFPHGLTRL